MEEILSQIGIGNIVLAASFLGGLWWQSHVNKRDIQSLRTEIASLRGWQRDHEEHCHDRQKTIHGKVDVLMQETGRITGILETMRKEK